MQTDAMIEKLSGLGVIPVISLENADDADPLADALVAGGLPVAEVVFRTASAEDSIRALAARDDLLVGAGTVLTPEQADRAQAAGAEFALSPGINPTVVRHCLEIGLPIFPGVSTPSEIERALELGLSTVKFFPAEALGGVATLKAIAAPYKDVRFIPTGGIDAGNLSDYLALECVIACGGSWIVKSSLISAGEFSQIEQLAREAVKLAQAV